RGPTPAGRPRLVSVSTSSGRAGTTGSPHRGEPAWINSPGRDTPMASTRSYSSAWAGWVVFAAAMLLILGTFNVIEGLVGLINDKVLVLIQDRLVVVDRTGWACARLSFGAVPNRSVSCMFRTRAV